MEVETKVERIERLRALRQHRPLTFARLVESGRITADDLAELDAPEHPVDG